MMTRLHCFNLKNSVTIYPHNYPHLFHCGSSYPKTKSWKENRDCCLWEGVTCDTTTGHVIGLDLSCSKLDGIIHPNSTLFHLSHLQTLNLAYTLFYLSYIPPNCMVHFARLKVLNLSYTDFFRMGDIPNNFGLPSQLLSLDLSYSIADDIEMHNIDKIVRNLTNLRELVLNGVSISSTTFLHTLSNLSSLTSLELFNCKLQGSFPSSILSLPHLQSLKVNHNYNLYVNASYFHNLSSSLQVIDFSQTNFIGRLPEYSLGSQPPKLRRFMAWYCKLYGAIPTWIWNTTKTIAFGGNNLNGKLPLNVNSKQLSNLTDLFLWGNLLNGPIPSWLMNLPSLKNLLLHDNQFIGKVPEPFHKGDCLLEMIGLGSNNNVSVQLNFLTTCNNLNFVHLSNTSIIGGVIPTFFWPNLSELYMSSCNITSFPIFSSSQKALKWLDLSNNKIQGAIPTWFYNVGKDSLLHLNISHNKLTGGLNLLSWNILAEIDLRSNSLQGFLPLPPKKTLVFLASNNKFHGEINSSFCDLNELLIYLDLSNNHLNGTIPKCLGKLSRGLEVLDLGSNLFHGFIQIRFANECNLKSIYLNNNNFKGKVPRSLMRCERLEVIELRNNRFNDSFPHWLNTLPELKVLVLKSNNFQGLIKDDSGPYKHPFPKLQILDLSNNQFYGKLPLNFFKMSTELMMNNGGSHNKGIKYVGSFYNYYQDSLVLTMKGLSLTYKILTILAALDLSNNSFSGEIPDSMGKLVALVALNVSHNQLTGRIPTSLANLTTLNSLDLSFNMLKGEIPPQLLRLTFLEVFNVSKNQLEGPIPQGNQFSTFSNDSFGGNSGLCGDPLPKCGESGGSGHDHQLATLQSEQEGNGIIDIITKISLLEIILLGFGLGAVLGSSIGYCMLSSRKPNWFLRNADRFEGVMVQRHKKHSRRQRRRK